MQRLQHDQEIADKELSSLQEKLDEYDAEMKQLKVKLYAKFGDNISTSSPHLLVYRKQTDTDKPNSLKPQTWKEIKPPQSPATLYLYPLAISPSSQLAVRRKNGLTCSECEKGTNRLNDDPETNLEMKARKNQAGPTKVKHRF